MEADLWQVPVTYGAVGATKAVDLLTHPPEGYRAIERRQRIGHGDVRFAYAWAEAMSWGIQKHSGFRVEYVDAPAGALDSPYVPVVFDDEGKPVTPANSETEHVFTPEGHPLLVAGDTVVLRVPLGPFGVKAPARVVYIVDEPNRKGFAYGTLPGHPEDGEEAFIVDRRDDGSVWITIRAFSRPSSKRWWLVYPVLRVMQELITRRYLRALAGPLGS